MMSDILVTIGSGNDLYFVLDFMTTISFFFDSLLSEVTRNQWVTFQFKFFFSDDQLQKFLEKNNFPDSRFTLQSLRANLGILYKVREVLCVWIALILISYKLNQNASWVSPH